MTSGLISADKCLFRGKCGDFESPFGKYPIPCIVDEEPVPLSSKSKATLKQLSPELFKTSEPLFCCTDQQVTDIEGQLSMAKSLMNRCPSCYANFAKIFFHMTCSPKQSEFLEVTKKKSSPTHPSKEMLVSLNYYMTDHYANETFNSCVNVKFPNGQGSIMNILCGGKSPCTVQNFFDYVGNPVTAPFGIKFNLGKDSKGLHKPMNATVVSCSEPPVPFSNSSCNCVDCPSKCANNIF